MDRRTLFGSALEQGSYHARGGTPWYIFTDAVSGTTMAIDERCAFQHVLLLGGSGSGKTNVMNQIVAQARALPRADEDVLFIFDTKGDYISHDNFLRRGDYILGNSRQFRDRSMVWNVFDEVLADGADYRDVEANAHEIASELFRDRGSQTQPFFADAARDIFASTLILYVRRAAERTAEWQSRLNNYDLLQLLQGDSKRLMKHFELYPDMRGLFSYVGDGTSNQALGVFGELRSMLNDCFQGIFAMRPASEAQSFSVRRAIRRKGGRAIFLEYDLSLGETMIPMYRLLCDLTLKEALSSNASGRCLLFLDELKLLPKVSHLEDALNFGRSKQVSVVAGLQSVSQIYSIYGEDVGATILGGFGSVIAMRTPDYPTREYITKLFGPNIVAYRYHTLSNTPLDREREGSVVEHWQIQALRTGQAIVGLASQSEPYLFNFQYGTL